MLIRGKAKTEDLIYAACAFECEGCVYISRCFQKGKYLHHDPCMNIANIDKRLVDWLHDTFGGYIYTEQPKRLSKRVIYRWKLHSRHAIDFLKLILPYLKFKRERAEIAIELWTLKPNLSPSQRDEYWLRLKALNQGRPPAETKRNDSELNLRNDSPTLEEIPVSI